MTTENQEAKIPDIPEIIYIQVGDDMDGVESFMELDVESVTWCGDRIHNNDIEYRRTHGDAEVKPEELLEWLKAASQTSVFQLFLAGRTPASEVIEKYKSHLLQKKKS